MMGDTQAISRFWNFLAMYPPCSPEEIVKNDPEGDQVLFVFGSRNRSIPPWAAELYHQLRVACPGKDFPMIVTGKPPIRDNDPSAPSEAEFFRDQMLREGIPERLVFMEKESNNTLQNVQNGLRMLRSNGVVPRRIFIVGVPFQMRRAIATFKRQALVIQEQNLIPWPMQGNPMQTTGYTPDQLVKVLAQEVAKLVDYASCGDIADTDVPSELLTLAMQYNATRFMRASDDRATRLPGDPLF